MDESQIFVRYKSITIIIALIVTFTTFVLLLINIEVFKMKEMQNKANEQRHYDVNDMMITEYSNKVANYSPQTSASNIYSNYLLSLEVSSNKHFLNETHDVLSKLKMFPTNYMQLRRVAVCSFIKSCTVSCKGGTIQEVVEEINTLIENGNTCTAQHISLELNSVTFPTNTISPGWLNELAIEVNGLKIKSIQLEELGEFAFSGKPFGNGIPLSLTLTDTNLKHFRKSTFTGSTIFVLEIKFASMRPSIIIEENVLGDTSYTVQSISMNHCLGSGEAIKNLTGKGNVMAGLRTLDLSYNMITKLESDTFINVPNLEQLYLISNGLTEIEVGAFKGLGKISQLHITNNNLKTLTPGVFNDLDSILSLYLGNNPWNCTCDMQWFRDYLMTIPQLEYRQCREGSNWVNMEDVEFCPSNSTTTQRTTRATTPSLTESTESSVTIPVTTPKDLNYFIFEKLRCRNLLSYPFENLTDDAADLLLESVFKRRNINVTMIEIGNSLTYRVDLVGLIKSTDFLVWTNVYDRSDYGCIFNINGYVLLTLQFQNTYTICFSSNDTVDTYAIIADDCTAISTPADWNHRAWLNNNQKIVVVLSVTFIFFVTLAIASSAVYYLVKYNPELIKGNKRVLIVKRGSYSPNVLVMPSKKETIRQVSLQTNYEGYLTPKFKRWAKNRLSDLRYRELETISDNSIGDGPGDKMIRKDSGFDEKTNEINIYESPPPLPPNHPGKRRDSGRPYFYSNM